MAKMIFLKLLDSYGPKRAGSQTITATDTHPGGDKEGSLKRFFLFEEFLFARRNCRAETILRIMFLWITAAKIYLGVLTGHYQPLN